MQYELALIMPVYNEEECICEVVSSWLKVLTESGINFSMIVLNDGSRDKTEDKLAIFSCNSRITVINKINSGHGPTILEGYRIGAELAEWIFQTDSDDEMKPQYFNELWCRRHEFDVIIGSRQGRTQCISRALISFASRITVRIIFGSGVQDVNSPYRLMRSRLLKSIIIRIPAETFAPNIIISGEFAISGASIHNHAVPHEVRKTGKVSIVKWSLLKSVCISFLQTLLYRYAKH